MDLTPRQPTPWWNLLRCCQPTSTEPNDDEQGNNDGGAQLKEGEAVRSGAFYFLYSSIESLSLCTHSWLSYILDAEESKGKSNDTASTLVEYPASSSCRDECIRDQVSDCQDNTVHYNQVIHHGELISFWQFLLLMMLRQVGIDYVSGRSCTQHIQSAAETSTDRSSMVIDEEIPEM